MRGHSLLNTSTSPEAFAGGPFHKPFTMFAYPHAMTMDQFLTDVMESKTRRLLSRKDEKLLILETLKSLALMTEIFREEINDIHIRMSANEILEWDSGLRRFVYHRGETSQFLELARKEILFRVRPFLEDLLKKARETL